MQSNNMLQALCKTSAEKAVSAMSKFLKTPVKFQLKSIRIEPIEKINLPNHQESAVGIIVPINNTVNGGSLFLSSTKSALATCDLMLEREEGDSNVITEKEEDALKEFANVLLGNFLTPLAHSLLISSMMHSSAIFEQNTATIIGNHMRTNLMKDIDEDSVLNIAFSYELSDSDIKGDINIILDAKKMQLLFRKMTAMTTG